MDLTYNITSKEKESGRLTKKKIMKINNNNKNNASKSIDQNEIQILNSEVSNISTQKIEVNHIKGENNKSESNLEVIKEIKLNLEENLKNIFNFSYENFHKDDSESGFSTKKSHDLSEMDDINLCDYKIENEIEDLIFKNFHTTNPEKKKINFHNQISFEENEEKIKERLFKINFNRLNAKKGLYESFYQNN